MRSFRFVSACAALVAVCSSASAPIAISVSAAGTAAGAQTICATYTKALNISEAQLITAVVARAVLGTTLYNQDSNYVGATINNNQVTGLVTALPTFFDGSMLYDLNKNPTTGANLNHDFISSYGGDKVLFNTLATKLVKFFGAGLGCKTLKPDTGAISMKEAHAGMNITQTVFNTFNKQVADSFTSFGGDATTDLPNAGALLASFGRAAGANEICTDATCDLAPTATSSAKAILPSCAIAIAACVAAIAIVL